MTNKKGKDGVAAEKGKRWLARLVQLALVSLLVTGVGYDERFGSFWSCLAQTMLGFSGLVVFLLLLSWSTKHA